MYVYRLPSCVPMWLVTISDATFPPHNPLLYRTHLPNLGWVTLRRMCYSQARVEKSNTVKTSTLFNPVLTQTAPYLIFSYSSDSSDFDMLYFFPKYILTQNKLNKQITTKTPLSLSIRCPDPYSTFPFFVFALPTVGSENLKSRDLSSLSKLF